MTAENQTINMTSGSTKKQPAIIYDAEGNLFDLTSTTVRWVMRLGNTIILTKDNDTAGGLTITDAAGGAILIAIDPEDTQGLDTDEYRHECKVYSGADEYTVFRGKVNITEGHID